MERQYLWNMYTSVPIVTRVHTTACILFGLAVHMDLLTPYQVYLNPHLVIYHFQWWRLLTCFLYYGPLDFHFMFNIMFTYGYCRGLEESSFSNEKTADFIVMFVFGMVATLFIGCFANLILFGPAFTFMLVYVWCRRNPTAMMNFFGLFSVYASMLPLVFLGFAILLGDSGSLEIVGIVVGHTYYYLEDVFPRQRGGFRVLKPPKFLQDWLHPREEQEEQEGRGIPEVAGADEVPVVEPNNLLPIPTDHNNNNINDDGTHEDHYEDIHAIGDNADNNPEGGRMEAGAVD